MSRYIIAPQAVQDLDEISNYFLLRNVEVGERWFQAFSQKCQQLVQFPMMGRSYANIRADLRGVPLEEFVIFYRVAGDRIEIMRIVSGKRNINALFSDVDDD